MNNITTHFEKPGGRFLAKGFTSKKANISNKYHTRSIGQAPFEPGHGDSSLNGIGKSCSEEQIRPVRMCHVNVGTTDRGVLNQE
jgi:hypothetical protein